MAAAVFMAVLLFVQAYREQTQPKTETEPPVQTFAPTQQTEPTQPQTEEPSTQAAEQLNDPILQQAAELLEQMSLHEKLCQMVILSPDTLTGESPTLEVDEAAKTALEQYPVSGFSFSQQNISTREQTAAMLHDFQEHAKIGLFFSVDEEGGTVWRVMGNEKMGTPRLQSMFSYKDAGGVTAYENAQTIAQELSVLGFNLNFAPVADVWSNPSNTVIGKRAYSDSFTQAAELIPQAVNGFHAGGILCTLKHFPGHGSTTGDSHEGAAIIRRSMEQLRAEELPVFQAGIRAGADMVMIGHLIVQEASEQEPATFSYAIVTELLREELGFDGVVITDALGMGALAEYNEVTRCQKAIMAGCDILLGMTQPEETLSQLQQLVQDNEIPESRIDESVLRILKLKIANGIYTP